jgi:hypothetical protein
VWKTTPSVFCAPSLRSLFRPRSETNYPALWLQRNPETQRYPERPNEIRRAMPVAGGARGQVGNHEVAAPPKTSSGCAHLLARHGGQVLRNRHGELKEGSSFFTIFICLRLVFLLVWQEDVIVGNQLALARKQEARGGRARKANPRVASPETNTWYG